MKKLLKWTGIAAGVLALLLIVGTIALKIFFPAEKVKRLVLKELTEKLKREVSIDQVSVGLVKGLEMENLRISEAPTFAKGTFISVDNLGVRIRLLPLLSKRVEVDTIILTAPKIAVTRAADGKTFNFSDLLNTSSRQVVSRDPRLNVNMGPGLQTAGVTSCSGLIPCAYAAPMEPAPAAPAFALQVSQLEIQKGQVHVVDHSPARMNVDLDETDLKVVNFSMTDFFAATWRTKIRGMGLAAVTQGSAKVNLQTAVVQLANAVVTVGESKIEASGQITDYTAASPNVALKIVLDALTPASFGSLAALPPALQWVGPATGGLELHGTLQNLDIGGDLKLDTAQIRYGTLFEKPAKVPLSFSFNGSILKQSTADIRTWGLKLGSLSATGHARFDGLAQKLPTISLHVATDEFSTTDLLALLPGALPPGVKVQGPAQFSADVTGTPASNHIVAKISGTKLVISSSDTFRKPAGMPFDVVFKGESVESGQLLNIESLTLALARIEFVLSGQYQTQGKDARLALTLKSNDFPLEDVAKISPAAAGYQLSGPGHVEMKISSLMSAPAVDGTVTMRQANLKSAEEQVQQMDARIHFATSNALAPAARMTLNTDGQFSAQNVHHTYYDGAAVKLVWALSNVMQTPDQPRIAGTAQLSQGAGVIRNINKLAQQSKTAGIMLLPFQVVDKAQSLGLLKQAGVPAMSNMSFNSIHGDYTFQPGNMTIRAFDLVGSDLSLGTTGTVGLVGGDQAPVNLSNQAKLAVGAGGALGDAFKDDQGRPTFKFTVTGPRGDPKVKVDLADAGKKIGNALLKNISTTDPNQALQDIGNNLKNLFKH